MDPDLVKEILKELIPLLSIGLRSLAPKIQERLSPLKSRDRNFLHGQIVGMSTAEYKNLATKLQTTQESVEKMLKLIRQEIERMPRMEHPRIDILVPVGPSIYELARIDPATVPSRALVNLGTKPLLYHVLRGFESIDDAIHSILLVGIRTKATISKFESMRRLIEETDWPLRDKIRLVSTPSDTGFHPREPSSLFKVLQGAVHQIQETHFMVHYNDIVIYPESRHFYRDLIASHFEDHQAKRRNIGGTLACALRLPEAFYEQASADVETMLAGELKKPCHFVETRVEPHSEFRRYVNMAVGLFDRRVLNLPIRSQNEDFFETVNKLIGYKDGKAKLQFSMCIYEGMYYHLDTIYDINYACAHGPPWVNE